MGLRTGQRWYDGALIHVIGDYSTKASFGRASKDPRQRYTRCGEPAGEMPARLPRRANVTCISCLSDSPETPTVLVPTLA